MSTARHSPRPLRRRIAASIVLGGTTALAVAWAAAALMPLTHRWTPGPAPFNLPVEGRAMVLWDRPWNVVTRRRAGVEDLWWDDCTQDYPGRTPHEVVAELNASMQRLAVERPFFKVLNDLPAWGTFAESTPPASGTGSDTAFGWPWPCMWYRIQATRTGLTMGGDVGEGMIFLHGGLSCRVREFAALPLRLRWTGLLADASLFGAAWLALLTAIPALRRGLRRRRGRCGQCGYDRAGLAREALCPECGT